MDHCLSSSTSLVMPISDPRDGFFYPTLALMIDSYVLGWCIFEIISIFNGNILGIWLYILNSQYLSIQTIFKLTSSKDALHENKEEADLPVHLLSLTNVFIMHPLDSL